MDRALAFRPPKHAVAACRKVAVESGRPARCTISVKAPRVSWNQNEGGASARLRSAGYLHGGSCGDARSPSTTLSSAGRARF